MATIALVFAWALTGVPLAIGAYCAACNQWPETVVLGSLAILGWFVTGILRVKAGRSVPFASH